MLDPEIADRVRELMDGGVLSGDAIGIAAYERDHADDPLPWWYYSDDEEDRR